MLSLAFIRDNPEAVRKLFDEANRAKAALK